MKSLEWQIAALAARIANLEDRRLPEHSLTEHTDVDLQGATSGSAVVRGAGDKYRPGSAAAGGAHSVLLFHSSLTAVPAGGINAPWDEPVPPDTYNLGGLFEWESDIPDRIIVTADCVVRGSAYCYWEDASTGDDFFMSVNGLLWGPSNGSAFRNVATANPIPTILPFQGQMVGGDWITVSLGHSGVGDEDVDDIFIELEVIWLP